MTYLMMFIIFSGLTIICIGLYETFKPYKHMWSHCVVLWYRPKIEKIRFERQWRDRDDL